MAIPVNLVFLAAMGALFYSDVSAACSMQAGDILMTFAYHCVRPLMNDFRNSNGRSFPSNIYNLEAWNDICSGLSELPKCIEDIDLPTCEDANKTEIIQEAEIFFTSEWEHLGFHPTTGTCNASAASTPMYNDHISQLYGTPTQVCRELLHTTIDKCTANWLIAQTISSPEAKSARAALEVYQCVEQNISTRCGPAGHNLAKFIVDQTMPEDLRDDINLDDVLKQEDSGEDQSQRPAQNNTYPTQRASYEPKDSANRLIIAATVAGKGLKLAKFHVKMPKIPRTKMLRLQPYWTPDNANLVRVSTEFYLLVLCVIVKMSIIDLYHNFMKHNWIYI
ncbi:hypothetical protein CAPTEDRAFT_214903 [Capitella teleta]|uniref:Secreted protein n=1 Tax=Capitella teleta TaxID=283909 RepID=R7ULK6_CAPTE|nr:hypothetical protein CAPTEDRAFT_214903 [Capitella teleta]|eukprot:ELU07065.1 hypothetical protein CAPTEDRAFT_214903 [Capitella teleta]